MPCNCILVTAMYAPHLIGAGKFWSKLRQLARAAPDPKAAPYADGEPEDRIWLFLEKGRRSVYGGICAPAPKVDGIESEIVRLINANQEVDLWA